MTKYLGHIVIRFFRYDSRLWREVLLWEKYYRTWQCYQIEQYLLWNKNNRAELKMFKFELKIKLN